LFQGHTAEVNAIIDEAKSIVVNATIEIKTRFLTILFTSLQFLLGVFCEQKTFYHQKI
jgi:hypothetical protein